MRLDYKAPYDLGMRSPADQEEVIYEIVIPFNKDCITGVAAYAIIQLGR